MKNQLVEFDAMACCAMREAFSANLEKLAHLKLIVGEEKFKIVSDIFKSTVSTGVFMKTEVARFYYVVAGMELVRLKLLTLTVGLPCGHKAYEHIRALEGLQKQIILPQQPN